VLQFDLHLFAPVERPGHGNEMIPEVLIDPVIPQFVGIRQGGARHRAPEADVVELFVMRVQACLDVPQALPVRKLRKGQAQQLIIAGKASNPVIAVIAAHAFVELISRQMLKELRKDRPSWIHRLSSPVSSGKTTGQNGRCKFKSEKTKTVTFC